MIEDSKYQILKTNYKSCVNGKTILNVAINTNYKVKTEQIELF